MALETCPKCKQNSYAKKPMGRIMRESLGCMIHISNRYQWGCLNPKCKYSDEPIHENTKAGDHFDLPWYKRIFKTL